VGEGLTSVGLRRVSIGPPISVMLAGALGSSLSSISATAASKGTDGWQMPSVWTPGPR